MLSNRQWWRTNLLHYSVLFILVSLFIFLPYWLSGTSLVWQSDGITQHFTALAQWQRDLQHLFGTGQWPTQWNWHIGLGADYYQTFSYYTLGDIFSYGVGFVSAEHILAYYECLLIIRLFLAGIAALWAIKYFTNSQNVWSNTIASLTYVFTGYTAFSAFEHPFFINPLIILPLLIISFDYVLRQNKMLPFTIMVFWTLWNNYYFAFILFLALAIYLLVQTTLTKQWLNWQRHLRMLSAGLLGSLMAMVLFLPNVLGVLTSSRSGAPLANGLLLYPIYYYLALPGTLLVNANTPNFWFTGGLASIFILALIFIIRRRHHYQLLATIFIIAGVGLLFPAFAAIFNGGSSPSNRWTFLLALPLAIATVYFLNHLQDLTRKDWFWFTIVGVMMTMSLFIAASFSYQHSFGILLALYVLTLFVIHTRTPFTNKRWLLLTLVTVLNVIVLMTHTHEADLDPTKSPMLSRQTVQKLLTEQKNYPAEQVTSKATLQRSLIENPLYNATGIAPGNNLGLLSAAHSIDSYWSYQNGATNQFMTDLGVLTSTNNNVTNDLNNRSVLSHILGVNQVFQDANKPKMANYTHKATVNHQWMGTSAYAYPLAYVMPHTTAIKTFEQASPTQREALLVDSVVTDEQAGTPAQFVDKLVTGQLKQTKQSAFKNTVPYHYTTQADNSKVGLYLAANPALKDTELHLELSNIQFTPHSFDDAYRSAFDTYKFKHQEYEADEDTPDLLYNPQAFKYQWYKDHIGQYGSDMGGYSITTNYNGQKQKFTQTSQKNLSFFNPRTSATINLGPATDMTDEQFISLKFSQPGTYSFDVKLVGIPTDQSFTTQAKQIQQNAVPFTIKNDQLSTTFTTAKPEIITTSIPFSTGWQSTTHELINVNHGFIGIKAKAGTQDIELNYQTPGLRLGILLSSLGFISFIGLVIYTLLTRRRHKEIN